MPLIDLPEGERNSWRVVQSVISIIRKWNARGQISLRANQTTTTVTKATSPGAVNVAQDDEIMLSPRTANAAAALTNVYVSSVIQGSFTLTHSSVASVDRTYGWAAR